MSINQSLTVSFQDSSSASSYKMEIDTEYNEIIYEENKSNFEPGEDIYLKLFPGESVETYSLSASEGVLTVSTKNILYDVEDQITFAYSKQGSLSYVPDSITSYEWLGEDGGTPVFSGQNIVLSVEKTAVLKVSYKTKGDRLKLSDVVDLGEEFTVICASIFSSGNVASQTISFQETDSEDSEDSETITDVLLTFKDIITEIPVSGAQISVSGNSFSFTGITDSLGKINIPNLERGKTYNLFASATGYQDSNTDHLNNDSFTVPELEE